MINLEPIGTCGCLLNNEYVILERFRAVVLKLGGAKVYKSLKEITHFRMLMPCVITIHFSH